MRTAGCCTRLKAVAHSLPAIPAIAAALIIAACAATTGGTQGQYVASNKTPSRLPQDSAPPEAVSLLGDPLYAPPLPPEVRAQRELDLESAQYDYDRDPHDEDAIIWVGRRLAYLGRYNEATNIFSNGLALNPDSYRLRRHRGHRYITIRKFDLAIADLRRAAVLIEGVPDEVEPDGQPNARNIPTSTTHTNIYYHLGLALYLTGDYAGAADAYRQCMEYSKNDDMRVATAYWEYLTLRRLHRDAEAASLLASISPDMTIIENAGYHRLLQMFKGELSPEQVMPGDVESDASIDQATTGYGIGMWRMFRGEQDESMHRFRGVVKSTNWAAFGHIAAEAEIARQSK